MRLNNELRQFFLKEAFAELPAKLKMSPKNDAKAGVLTGGIIGVAVVLGRPPCFRQNIPEREYQ